MNLPDDLDHVRHIFIRRGAYSRFKEFVEAKGLLQFWYDFEAKQQEQALRQWCEENDVELNDQQNQQHRRKTTSIDGKPFSSFHFLCSNPFIKSGYND